MSKSELTVAITEDPDFTDTERAMLRVARRGQGKIRNAGAMTILEILAAIGDLSRKPPPQTSARDYAEERKRKRENREAEIFAWVNDTQAPLPCAVDCGPLGIAVVSHTGLGMRVDWYDIACQMR